MSKCDKISETDFKIRLLEQREGLLSEAEILRLKSLREQVAIKKANGWEEKKLVPLKALKKFNQFKKPVKVVVGLAGQVALELKVTPGKEGLQVGLTGQPQPPPSAVGIISKGKDERHKDPGSSELTPKS